MKLAEIIDETMPVSAITPQRGAMRECTAPPVTGRRSVPDQFECRVFQFLFAERDALGISRVFRASNFLVDGGVELTDGRCLVVEVKYRMNWSKACQAGWQLSAFLRRHEARDFDVAGGLVFFEDFSGDWARRCDDGTERGWSYWYAKHATLPERRTFRIDLLRVRGGVLETHPTCRAEDT